MKKWTLLMMSLAMTFAVAGCNLKNPNDINKDLEKKLAEDRKKNDDFLNTISKSLEQGGQPVSLKVSGIIVDENSKTDLRITVLSKGGLGKDGTEAPIAKENKPVLASKNETLDLSKMNQGKSLISLGCDAKVASDLAQERSLEVQNIPAPITADIMIISAKTIVLCGKMDGIEYQYLTFNADELILNQANYSQATVNSLTQFNANKLLLLGASTLTTKRIDRSTRVSPFVSLELNVLKEIDSNADGKVLLMSIGADYKADSK